MYYLKSIKANTDKAGDEAYLKFMYDQGPGTDSDIVTGGGPDTSYQWYKIGIDEESVSAAQLNTILPQYEKGYEDVKDLYKDINKVTDEDLLKDINLGSRNEGKGLKSILGSTILKEISQVNGTAEGTNQNTFANVFDESIFSGNSEYDEAWKIRLSNISDTGFRKNIYIRWDLLCQIINQLCQDAFKSKRVPGVHISSEGEEKKLQVPICELTYMGPNQKVVSLKKQEGKVPIATWRNEETEVKTDKYYLSYTPPVCKNNDPACAAVELHYQSQADDDTPNIFSSKDFHPLLGLSVDPGICIMPHEPRLEGILAGTSTWYDPDFTDDGPYGEGGFFPDPHYDSDYQGLWGDIMGALRDDDDQDFNQDDLDESKIAKYVEWKKNQKAQHSVNFDLLTSYEGVQNKRNAIGLVYFNLDHLMSTYRSMRYTMVETTNKNPDDKSKTLAFKDDFSMFDFIEKIWKDVNRVTGGYYNFQLSTEHERPGVARIIDKQMSGTPKGGLFQFDPQGRGSITRNFNFESQIDNDMASVISIAAQAPSEIYSLESVSFKAFHKNVKNRFSDQSVDEEKEGENLVTAKKKLLKEIKEFRVITRQLFQLFVRISSRDFTTRYAWEKRDTESRSKDGPFISPGTAIRHMKKLEELQRAILSKYPLNHPTLPGLYKEEASLHKNAIIPLTYNFTMDGIAGILPLQLFRINPVKLPKAYQRDDIVFIVSGEEHRITAGQDWSVSIKGQLTLQEKFNIADLYGGNTWDEATLESMAAELGDEASPYIPTATELESMEGSPWPTGYRNAGWGYANDSRANGMVNPVINWPPHPASAANAHFSSPWGRVRTRTDGTKYRHAGVDIPVAQGSKIVAPFSGIIKKAYIPGMNDNNKVGEGCGGTIMMDLDNDITVRFCHVTLMGAGNEATNVNIAVDHNDLTTMIDPDDWIFGGLSTAEFEIQYSPLKEGDWVRQGRVIGYSGGTANTQGAGNSEEPHLHYEVYTGYSNFSTFHPYWWTTDYPPTNTADPAPFMSPYQTQYYTENGGEDYGFYATEMVGTGAEDEENDPHTWWVENNPLTDSWPIPSGEFNIIGCTDSNYIEYNPQATVGCTDCCIITRLN